MSISIIINKKQVEVPEGLTILQACEYVGIQIPRFCYHDKLSVAGNCRMCLVHLEKSVKPVASCAITVSEGMSIYTDTSFVRKAREGVMEFLLANHPLDCPICDQGGECDLQDQALFFGNDRGRFYEIKRAVSDKNCGPLIKTIMTRCIHCTRCVRFSQELSGFAELTTTGRGSHTEIGNYVSKSIKSVVSGNLIDLCPVGALTSKPYAFTARSWELKRRESVDTLDSMGSNLSVQTFGRKVMRILPVLHEGINQEWLNDRSRFSYDGILNQRILGSLFKREETFEKISLISMLNLFCYFFSILNKRGYQCFILGNEVSLESAFLIKKWSYLYGGTSIILLSHVLSGVNVDFRRNYVFNSSFSNLDKADSCLIIGVDLNQEMPLLLLRLRKRIRAHNISLGFLGLPQDYGIEGSTLGNSLISIVRFIEGKDQFCTALKTALFPAVIVGSSVLECSNFHSILPQLQRINALKKLHWDGLNFLQSGSNKVGFFELGLTNNVPKRAILGSPLNSYICFDSDSYIPKNKTRSMYIGSHGFKELRNFKGLIPGVTSIEKEATYVNVEGRPQQTHECLLPAQGVQSEEGVLSGLLYLMEEAFKPYGNVESIRKEISKISNSFYNSVGYSSFNLVFSEKGFVDKSLLLRSWSNFYVINARTQVSPNMVNCLKGASHLKNRIYR